MCCGEDTLKAVVLYVMTILLDVLALFMKFWVAHNKDGSFVFLDEKGEGHLETVPPQCH